MNHKEELLLLQSNLQALANVIDANIPDGYGFTLMVTKFNQGEGSVCYVSNCDTVGMLDLVEGWLKDVRAGNAKLPDVPTGRA